MPSIYVYELERWSNRAKRGEKKFGERGLSVWRESEGEKKLSVDCQNTEWAAAAKSKLKTNEGLTAISIDPP